MGGFSWWHWLIILAVFILLFGAKKLPDAARGVGRSLRILKSEVSAMHEDDAAKGKVVPPAETDASASLPTPAAQLNPAPAPLPPVGTPAYQQPAVVYPATQAGGAHPAQAAPVYRPVTDEEHRAS
jgi:sec-independent protein translocase protein TatA